MKKELALIMVLCIIGVSSAYGDSQINLKQSSGQTVPSITVTDSSSNVLFQVLNDGQAIINKFIRFSGSGLNSLRTYVFPDSSGTVILHNATQTISNKVLDADSNSLTNIDDNEIKSNAAINVLKLSSGTIDNTEFDYLEGTTSNIQTQLDSKESTANKNAANGYPSLGAGGLVPTAQLGTGSASSSTFLRGDGIWNTPVGVPTIVRLGSDVGPISQTNPCCVDATGLSFSVSSGKVYHFKFLVRWDTTLLTRGIGLTLNGPTTTFLNYDVIYPTSQSGGVIHSNNAYDLDITTGTSILSTDFAVIEGLIQPSAAGTLIVRFQADNAASPVTIKANSVGFLTEIP